MTVFEVKAEILKAESIGPNIYKMSFLAPEIAGAARVGQFVNLKCLPGTDPLLRRPLTIFRANADAGTVEVVFKVVGRGTRILAERRPGEELEVLGPLGSGFTMLPGKLPILISGGIGVASLMALAEELVRLRQAVTDQLSIYVLIGAHTPEELVLVEEFAAFEKARVKTWVTRSNLEFCLAELTTELAGQRIAWSDCCVYACGPTTMLRRLAEFSGQQGLACQVSLESHMACGMGTCQGCICRLKNVDTYKQVCKHGPVFWAEEVVWDE